MKVRRCSRLSLTTIIRVSQQYAVYMHGRGNQHGRMEGLVGVHADCMGLSRAGLTICKDKTDISLHLAYMSIRSDANADTAIHACLLQMTH